MYKRIKGKLKNPKQIKRDENITHKGAFEEVSREWITRHAEAWDSGDEEGRKFTLSLGNKIVQLSKEETARWHKKTQPVIDDYVRRVESKWLPGKEYVEATKELTKKRGGK